MKRAVSIVIFLLCACTPISNLVPLVIPKAIDCALPEITELAISLIDDVNTCIGEGRQQFCDQIAKTPSETKCTWKKCLWDLARKQAKAHATEAVLCAVDQAGLDFGNAAAASNDTALKASAERANEFLGETGVEFSHRKN